MQATIRQATLADAEVATAISKQNFAESFGASYRPADLADFLAENYSLECHQTWLANNQYALFLLEIDGAQLGHALVGPCGLPHADVTSADGELKRLYVLKHAHGKGLGSKLLKTALSWLEKDGPRTLWLGVWSENFGGQKLYQRHGFERAGEYYFQVGASADFEFIFRRKKEIVSPR
jgi:diamine N-acetyltransferase